MFFYIHIPTELSLWQNECALSRCINYNLTNEKMLRGYDCDVNVKYKFATLLINQFQAPENPLN